MQQQPPLPSSSSSSTFGNSASYFTRQDEDRIEELQQLLSSSQSMTSNKNISEQQQQNHDPLAISVYETELRELQAKREKFIEEGLQNMMKASKQASSSSGSKFGYNKAHHHQNENSSSSSTTGGVGRIFHAFDDANSIGDGSASYFFTKMVGGFVSSILGSTDPNRNNNNTTVVTINDSTSSSPTASIVVKKNNSNNYKDNPDNNNNTPQSRGLVDTESTELSNVFSLGQKKQSDLNLDSLMMKANNKNAAATSLSNNVINVNANNNATTTSKEDSSSSSSLQQLNYRSKLSLTLAWSAFGACTLALFLQSMLHIQDPSRIGNNNNNKDIHRHQNQDQSSSSSSLHTLFHQESAMSVFLRLSEGFVGFLGSCALMLHLHFLSSSKGNTNAASASIVRGSSNNKIQATNSTNSSSKLASSNENTTASGMTKRPIAVLSAGHSRTTSFSNTNSIMNNNNPSIATIVPVSNIVTNNNFNIQSSPSTTITQPLSLPVRLLLRLCELAAMFLGVFAILYSALLIAPLKHVSDHNLLKGHIQTEQTTMKHVEVGMVLFWMMTNFICAFVSRKILLSGEDLLGSNSGEYGSSISTSSVSSSNAAGGEVV